MKGISAAVITYNEADRLDACLRALHFCDEIVVVDSGSTDGTPDIARKYTGRVDYREWTSFREQRNHAISLAGGDWILLVDADEVVSDELAASIKALPDEPEEDGFLIRRDLYFMGRLMRHGGAFPDWLLRLFRKDKAALRGSPTHDEIKVPGKVTKLDGVIRHYSYRDLEDYFARFNRYTSLAAQERYKKGKRFRFYQNFRPFYEFIMRYFIRGGFLDGYPGFVYAMNSSLYAWTKYTKLRELEDKKAGNDR